METPTPSPDELRARARLALLAAARARRDDFGAHHINRTKRNKAKRDRVLHMTPSEYIAHLERRHRPSQGG